MPIPAPRLASCIGALSATLLLGGVGAGLGAGVAIAGPGDNDKDRTSSNNRPGHILGRIDGPFKDRRGSSHPIRDALGIPKSIVGNMRGSGRRAVPTVNAQVAPDSDPKLNLPTVTEGEGDPPPTSGKASDGTRTIPLGGFGRNIAVIEVPGNVAFSFHMPRVPGTPATLFDVDLTGPIAAYTSARRTYETANTLAVEAVQPYSPFGPYRQEEEPSDPAARPAVKVYEIEEAPAVIDTGGGTPDVASGGGSGLTVLRMPVVVPAAVRLAPPRPYTETSPPAGSSSAPGPQGAGGSGGGGGGGSVVRGSEMRAGTPGEQLPPLSGGATPPSGNPVLREGLPPAMRTPRMVELTSLALPGLAGLLAITAGGSVIGYRQASSVRYLRSDAARFMT